jgi:hypothetical protein
MIKFNLKIILFFTGCLSLNLYSQVSLGADVVSRYVWRGTDYGNSASVQPSLSFTHGSFEIGAWGSYALTAAGAGANENDLYATLTAGPLALTVTDYYFPENFDLFNYSDEDGIHILEISAALNVEKFSILGAVNFSGDPYNSLYTEIGYTAFEKEDLSVTVFGGLGTHIYIRDPNGDFNLVNLGMTASKGPIFTSYIINPEAETNFLVFGYSF